MIDIVYRYDPGQAVPDPLPATPEEARLLLEQGNRFFAHMLDRAPDDSERIVRVLNVSPHDLGIVPHEGGPPRQLPFAIVVGCADARVPTELILGQGANDLFVVRVAGNVLGDESLGSIDYAIHQLAVSIRLIVVLGHTGCGAVTAAVDAVLDPSNYLALASNHQLRSIVNQIFPAVQVALAALDLEYGPDIRRHDAYRDALIETAVVVNAAMMASTLANDVEHKKDANIGVAFGVYDLKSRHIGPPGANDRTDPHHALIDPPRSAAGFSSLARSFALGPVIVPMLAPSGESATTS
jgi:carbonic anhydrase